MTTMIRASIFALAPSMASAAGAHTGPYEWAGIFNTPDASYQWIAQKATVVDGVKEYADPYMKLAAIAVSTGASRASLGVAEPLGESSLTMADGACEEVASGGTIKPILSSANAKCYKLKFDQSSSESTYTIDATDVASIAFFTEHVPTEFEDTKHYLKDVNGEDIEPVAQPAGLEGHSHGEGEPLSEEEEFGRYCVCQAERDGWTLDCKNMAKMNEAIAYMAAHEAECHALDPTQACINQYHVIQAHHDHCLHHDLPTDIEKILHEYEMFYQDCFIKRQYDSSLSQCPAVTCSNEQSLTDATATLLACEKTKEACAAGSNCAAAVKTVLMAHDTCPEKNLPDDLETGLHNYEDPCSAELCNAGTTATFDPYAQQCVAKVSGANEFTPQGAFLVTTSALLFAMLTSS